jgi:hypothetical protein
MKHYKETSKILNDKDIELEIHRGHHKKKQRVYMVMFSVKKNSALRRLV